MQFLPAADGQLLVVDGDGVITVLGRASDALRPAITVSSPYPAVGATVTVVVDAADRPSPERIILSWNDGTIVEVEPGAAVVGQYTEAGPRTLAATAVFEDGRTATSEVVLQVGGVPPADLNPLQRAFANENQDLTFGVLGIAIAVGGGFFALARQRTRRRRVQRELDAIETAYADTHDRPLDCEAALAERKAHVRGLGLDGKLDQSEVLLVERRIEELGQQLRLSSIDERFGFLTVNMARTLREMLADGRISAWEREHFLAALDADTHLTKAQKIKVKRQIEDWFAQDEGGAT